jgi:hypothetical protein
MTNSLTRAITAAIQRTHEGVCKFCNDDGCPVVVSATEEVRRAMTSWLVEEDTKTILIDTLMREWMKVEDGDIEPMSYNDEAWLVMGALVDHAREDEEENPEEGEEGDDSEDSEDSEDGDSDEDDKGSDEDADDSDEDGEGDEERGDGNQDGDNESEDGDPEDGDANDDGDSESEGGVTDEEAGSEVREAPVEVTDFYEAPDFELDDIEYEIVYRRGREIKVPVAKRRTYL